MTDNNIHMSNLRKVQVCNDRRRRRTVLSTIGVLIFIYLFLNMIFGEDSLLKYFQMRTATSDLKVEVDTIRKQTEEIRAEAELLKDGKDLTLIEKLARERGLVKKDEQVYKFVD